MNVILPQSYDSFESKVAYPFLNLACDSFEKWSNRVDLVLWLNSSHLLSQRHLPSAAGSQIRRYG